MGIQAASHYLENHFLVFPTLPRLQPLNRLQGGGFDFHKPQGGIGFAQDTEDAFTPSFFGGQKVSHPASGNNFSRHGYNFSIGASFGFGTKKVMTFKVNKS